MKLPPEPEEGERTGGTIEMTPARRKRVADGIKAQMKRLARRG